MHFGLRTDINSQMSVQIQQGIGRFDGFWELDLCPWDTAAAELIVREAGGQVTDFTGSRFSNYSKKILASNGLIHRKMINVLCKKK